MRVILCSTMTHHDFNFVSNTLFDNRKIVFNQKYSFLFRFQVAMATGCVLFQRFYYAKSFIRIPFDITAMSCICLASKIEEAPRRIRDIINVFNHIKQIRAGK